MHVTVIIGLGDSRNVDPFLEILTIKKYRPLLRDFFGEMPSHSCIAKKIWLEIITLVKCSIVQ